ncbi:MAG TPA: SDR family NAD(P)-dependent oxidoreductase [Acidobacteriota bacterium]|nr:SDR family NAD(P)-dependent oxidoreductase [Acidobacteriota bacterium]
MPISEKKVLITGADGFIGSHLAELLVRRGAEVRAMIWYNAFGHAGWLDQTEPALREKIRIVPGDIRDPDVVSDATAGADIVFHLASLVAIPYSYRSPDSYVDTNVRGTLNVLQAARRHGVAQVIHTSTSEVYGNAQYVPIDENHPLVGQSPYAATKIAADQLAVSFHCSFGLPVTILRPFNTYGPRQSARAVIPTIIVQLLAGKRVIKLGNVVPKRDFTYVDDVVEGFLAAAGKDRTVGEVIQLGSETEISIGDLAQKIADLMEVKATIETDPQRVRPEAGEVQRLLCKRSEAERLLGWAPTVPLEAGLRRTIRWLADHRDLPGYMADQYVI